MAKVHSIGLQTASIVFLVLAFACAIILSITKIVLPIDSIAIVLALISIALILSGANIVLLFIRQAPSKSMQGSVIIFFFSLFLAGLIIALRHSSLL